MPATIFPERRTRSQLTLPDTVLTIPEKSPLKVARSKNTMAAKDAAVEDSEEMLLSPRKTRPSPETSKRSASPPAQDEYMLGTSDGRDLKRVKRDAGDEENAGNDMDAESSGAIRTELQPRSAKKGYTPSKKKTLSVVSASPPPTTAYSPPPTNGRAQSVPLFTTAAEMPLIDLRKVPSSPKRMRSRSKSPSKEHEPKLRITNVVAPSRLPTIHAGIAIGSHSDGESSVPEEREMEIPAVPLTSSPSQPGDNASSSPPVPAVPAVFTVPATPAAASLDRLMPMSPLTPIPPTPFPPVRKTAPYIKSNLGSAMKLGSARDIKPMKDLTSGVSSVQTLPSTASSSRLPRTTMAPPAGPLNPGATAGEPNGATNSVIAPGSQSTAATAKAGNNAFDRMMAASRDKGKGKAKATINNSRLSSVGPSFAPVVSRPKVENLTAASNHVKFKLKDKMRRKEKKPVEKELVIEALPEEEEEEERQQLEAAKEKEEGERVAKEDERVAEEETQLHRKTQSPEPLATTPPATTVTDLAPDADVVSDVLSPADPSGVANSVETDVPSFNGDVVMKDAVHHPQDNYPAEEALPQDDLPLVNDLQLEDSPSENAKAVEEDVRMVADEIVEDVPLVTEELPATIPKEQIEAHQTEVIMDSNAVNEDVQMDKPIEDMQEPVVEQGAQDPPSPAKQSKISLGKKRQPTSSVAPARVTRSSSNRNPATESAKPALAGPSTKNPMPRFRAPLKRSASGTVKQPEPSSSSQQPQDAAKPDDTADAIQSKPTRPRTPGSPMKLSTPKKASPALTTKDATGQKYTSGALSLSSTPVATRRSASPTRAASSPSPTKKSRLPAYTPIGLKRTSSTTIFKARPGSSLSTLSSALMMLKAPLPPRPSTSMGFSLDAGDDTDSDILTTKDDVAVGRASLGKGLSSASGTSIQRSATLSSDAFKSSASSSSTASSSLSRPTASSQAKLVQRTLPFGPPKSIGTAKVNGAAIRGRNFVGMVRNQRLFGAGGGARKFASKKSSLPVVAGSPVKGGNPSMTMQEGNEEEDEEDEDSGGEIFNAIANNGASATTLLANLLSKDSDKDNERQAPKAPSHSRRVSMLSRDLTESLNAAAPGPVRGLMGPPPTPPSVTSTRSASDTGSPSAGSSSGGAKRSSARIAKSVSSKPPVVETKKRAMDLPPPNPAAEALQFLRDCVIFVDVKTDDGDEAGTLFIDMLGTMGARIAAGVGTRCTHIVFKNGLSSTTTKYKLLRDPKPLVVGIGWVVECVEQRRRVPEGDYLVDLEFMNIVGGNKRRRSMLPRLMGEYTSALSDSTADRDREKDDEMEDPDRSLDGSVSSVTMEDDGLAPLERARRRKNKMVALNQ